MNRKELVEHEIEDLERMSKNYLQNIETVLSDVRKERVKLWLVQTDRYRLLTLRTWEMKYKVSTKVLLLILLPFWESFVQRRSKKMKSRGLNVRVSTLTGKKSELILKDGLSKLYPSNENKIYWINNEKEIIIQNYLKKLEKADDGVKSRNDSSNSNKTLVDFSTPDSYMKYYRKQMQKEQKAREQIEHELKRYAYRDNPFHQELI